MEGGTRTWQWCWILFILLLGIQQLNGQSDAFIYGLCNVNKYSNGTDYDSDVNVVLNYLVSAAAPIGGFITYSYGGVNGLLQCRGDVSEQACQNCSVAALQLAYQDCPNAIGARIQLDFCFIRYENYTFASALDTTVAQALVNVNNKSDIQGFNETLGNLLEALAITASFEGKGFAVGSSVVNNNPLNVTIYALEMCFPSFAASDCFVCLKKAVAALNPCCSSQVGGRVYMGSCTVDFEIYPFYTQPYLR